MDPDIHARSVSFPVQHQGTSPLLMRNHSEQPASNRHLTMARAKVSHQLCERACYVLTSLDSYCTKDQEINYVQIQANLDKTAQEISKELKRLVYGDSSARYHNFMQAQRPPAKSVGKGEEDKDEPELYLFKASARDKMLAFVRFQPCSFPLRFLKLAQLPTLKELGLLPGSQADENLYLPALKRDKQLNSDFWLAFVSRGMIEQYLKAFGVLYKNEQSETAVVNSLSKAITSNSSFERKGKLKKKSLNVDTFKERTFVLDKDHLYYYKNERNKESNFNLIILNDAHIRLYSMDLQKPQEGKGSFPAYFNQQNPYLLEIQNGTRKFTLSAKSHFDLEEWCRAIQAQIESLRCNQTIVNNNKAIKQMEEQIANRDMWQVKNLTRQSTMAQSQFQPRLLDSVNDVFITELLPNITQYMNFAEQKDLQVRAQPMAAQIIQQLTDFLAQAQRIGDGQKFGNREAETQVDAYKRYKMLSLQEKITQLVTEEDLSQIKRDYQKMIAAPPNASSLSQIDLLSAQLQQINSQLFVKVLSRIVRVIKYNFLADFYRDTNSKPSTDSDEDSLAYLKQVKQTMVNRELLLELTTLHARNQPPLGFNSLARVSESSGNLPDKKETGKQANIFASMASRNQGKLQTGASGLFGLYGQAKAESKSVVVKQNEDLTIIESSPEQLKRNDSLNVMTQISTDSIKKIRQQ